MSGDKIEEELRVEQLKYDFNKLRHDFECEKKINDLKQEYEKQINDIHRDNDKNLWKERVAWITISLALLSIIIIIVITRLI